MSMMIITHKRVATAVAGLALALVGGLSATFALQAGQPGDNPSIASAMDAAQIAPGQPFSLATVPDWAFNRLGIRLTAPSTHDVADAVSRAQAIAAAKAFGAHVAEEAVLVNAQSLGYGPSNLPDGPIWVVSLNKTPVFGAIGPQDADAQPWTGRTADIVLVDARTGVALGEFATQLPPDIE